MIERSASHPVPPRAKALLPIGLMAISFASIFIKICDAPPLIIAAYRLGLATLALLLFTLPRTLRQFLQLGRQEILASVASGVFLCLHFAFWITSLKYTSVASSVILVTTNPLFVALASAFFLRERISLTLLFSILLAVLGGVIIAWGDWGQGRENLYGDFLALLGAIMATGYLLVGRRVRQKTGLSVYITLVYGVAAILLIFLAFASEESFFPYPPRTYLLFFLLAFVPQLIGHSTLNWALKYFSATWVAVLILGEPIGATILAYFFLKEPLTYKLFFGGTLVLLGIYFSAREERKLGKL
jgi:drug/metabolite transporter (DMT)-like permease